jgi:hypothetical protein
VSSATTKPEWHTGTLWGILAVLLVFGTVGAATFVYGALLAFAGSLWAIVALPLGGIVAVLAFLFIAGILYRVDRYRGVAQRRVDLFE